MSDQTRNRNDDSPIFLIIIWLPLVVIMIVTLSNNDDPNSLLTDEQKLEKQKEIELEKQEKELEDQKNAKWWKDSLNYIIDEKPAPYTFLAGIGILSLLVYSFKHRRYSDTFESIFNIRTFFPIFLLLVYIAWLSGYFAWRF